MTGSVRCCSMVVSMAAALMAAGLSATPTMRGPKSTFRLDRQGERLPPGAVARIGSARFRGFLTLAPDGRTPVTLRDNHACLIHPDTGREIRRLPGGDPLKDEAQCCLLSPNGRYVAYGGCKFIDIWDAGSGTRVCRCADDETQLGSLLDRQPLCFSPDSHRLITFSQNGFVPTQCWELPAGRLCWQFEPHSNEVEWQPLAFTPDGRYFVAVKRRQQDRLLCMLNAETGAIIHCVPVAHHMGAMALSPDGLQVAYSESQGTIRRVNVWTGIEEKVIDLPYGLGADGLVYSPDGKRLVGVHSVGLHIWDAATGQVLNHVFGIHHLIQPRAFIASDNRTLWITDREEPVWRRFDLASGREVKLPGAEDVGRLSAMAVSPDGRSLASSCGSVGTRLWTIDPCAPLRRLYDRTLLLFANSPELNSVAFSPDGQLVAGAGLDGHLYLWTTATGQLQRTVPPKEEFNGETVAFSPDGKTLAVAPVYVRDPSTEGIRLFDAASGKERLQLKGASGNAACFGFSPDGSLLLTLSQLEGETAAVAYDVASGAIVRQAAGGVHAAAFLPFGRNVLCSGSDGLFVWELSSGAVRLRLPLPPQEGLIDLLAVSPDGRLAAGANNGDGHYCVYLWDLHTGRELSPIVGHNHHVTGLTFGPSACMLVTTSKDTTALVWDLTDRLSMHSTVPQSSVELEAAWEALAGDAEAAHAAQIKLLSAGEATISLLRRLLPPPGAIDPSVISKAVADLDSPRFAERERAMREFERWDQQAEPFLRSARNAANSAETRRRLDVLLDRARGLSANGDQLRATRAVELLERINSPAARKLLAEWARGDPAARLTREANYTRERLRPKG